MATATIEAEASPKSIDRLLMETARRFRADEPDLSKAVRKCREWQASLNGEAKAVLDRMLDICWMFLLESAQKNDRNKMARQAASACTKTLEGMKVATSMLGLPSVFEWWMIRKKRLGDCTRHDIAEARQESAAREAGEHRRGTFYEEILKNRKLKGERTIRQSFTVAEMNQLLARTHAKPE